MARLPRSAPRPRRAAGRRRFDRTRRLSRRATRAAYHQARELPLVAAAGIVDAGQRRSPGSRRSVWSFLSYRSAGSVLSSGSLLSVASIGSAFSAGSILSFASAGSLLSVGSTGSILSIGSTGSILSIGATGRTNDDESDRDTAGDAAATVHRLSSIVAVAALGGAIVGGRLHP